MKEQNNFKKCQTCGKRAHDYETEEVLNCVPPKEVLTFGEHTIDRTYRNALYKLYPRYTAEEIIGSYLGNNPFFSDQATWLDEQQ